MPRTWILSGLQLTGRSGSAFKTFFYDKQRFPLRNESNDFLPRLWATRRVGWLMEQIRSNGEQKELRDEVVDLGTRYGIVTPYTSYLALEANETINVTSQQITSLPSFRRRARGWKHAGACSESCRCTCCNRHGRRAAK